jgi:hypothetical protein
MLYQEDIVCYFDKIVGELRDENIPIFNNIITDYPGFFSKEINYPDTSDEEDS